MTIDSRPIPQTALTAFRLTQQNFQRALDEIGRQLVADLGLAESDNWTVNFDQGVLTRDVAEQQPVAKPLKAPRIPR